MPEHNNHVKYNSHLGFVLDDELLEQTNDDSDYYEDRDKYVFKKITPLALILYSKEEQKYIYQRNLTETCPRNTIPMYLLVIFKNNDCDHLEWGLVRLGQLGVTVNNYTILKLSNIVPKSSIFNREHYLTSFSIISIDDISSTELGLHFFHGWYSDCTLVRMKIALCQKDITKTIAKYEFLEDFSLPDGIGSQVIRNGRKENAHLDTYYMESISIQEEFQSDYLKLVNHENDEIFIMKYHEGFGFYKWSAESLQVHFENYENFNFHSVKNVSCCQLTSCKYLVLFYSRDTLVDRPVPFLSESLSYQEVFINHMVWMLVDLKAHRVKRVYPSIYDLGKKNLCKDDLEETDGFQKVKLNRHGGKKGKQDGFVKYSPDGDLNGGYTDTILLDSLKHSKHDPINPKSLVPVRSGYNFNSELFCFRPFSENPELFQIHLFIPYAMEIWLERGAINWAKRNNVATFRFYFKFREEIVYEKLMNCVRKPRFTDIVIKC